MFFILLYLAVPLYQCSDLRQIYYSIPVFLENKIDKYDCYSTHKLKTWYELILHFRLIDWCLTPTLAIFQLYRGVLHFINSTYIDMEFIGTVYTSDGVTDQPTLQFSPRKSSSKYIMNQMDCNICYLTIFIHET